MSSFCFAALIGVYFPSLTDVCYHTEQLDFCGTPIIYSSGSCGPTVPCVFDEDKYDRLTNAATGGPGFNAYGTKPCYKYHIHRECTGGNCIVTSIQQAHSQDGTEAIAGDLCGGSG